MDSICLTAASLDVGSRIDAFLSQKAENISRSAAQNLIARGLVTVNGAAVVKNYRLQEGDCVNATLPEAVKLDAFPQDIALHILYEDEWLLVVEKPRGMVVHPAAGNTEGTLVNALLHHCEGRLSSINGVIRPGIVHRIDKDTSGLLVVAKDDATHTALSEQFSKHSIDRVYYAVVHGRLKNPKGTIDAPIGRHPNDRKKMCITQINSRRAVTHYELVEEYLQFSLVKLQLETGRTHQIRVHMASIGYPVAGDPVYGPKKGVELGGQCLHASILGFIHPKTGEHLLFESPLPEYFKTFLSKLKGGRDEKI